jgi:hypothetical protein
MRAPTRLSRRPVPNLNLQVTGVSVVPYAATPTLAFAVQIANAPAHERIHSVALRCQIRIEVTRRRYDRTQAAALLDLFGEPDRWGQTMRDMFWTHAQAHVPSFVESTSIDLPVPCSFDFNVAATKYFHGLADGDVPLVFLFSGSVFYDGPQGSLQVYPISWEKESRFRLPVATWRELMDAYYPNTNWLTIRRDAFERLNRYKQQHGIPTLDALIERMLAMLEEQVPQ